LFSDLCFGHTGGVPKATDTAPVDVSRFAIGRHSIGVMIGIGEAVVGDFPDAGRFR